MKTTGVLSLIVVLALLSSAKAKDAEVGTVPFRADLAVDAEGSPSIGRIEGVTGRLADMLRQQLLQMPYVPAQSEGTAVASSAVIRGTLMLTPIDGDTLDVRLDKVSAGPAPTRLTPIPYPPSQARARAPGHVEALLTLDNAGNVSEVAIVSASHRAFEQAVSDAVRKWRFTPVSPAPVRVSVTVVFHMANQEPPDVQFECGLDPGRLHVVGQSGCVEQMTVTGRML